ncbi:MAG TPA: DegT/DnrJ/EryC1/StrS family aminotransferase [Solirubrobacteraceae bacterium]|jgi:perosamine synthetase|nr:DegT/DnrJ/EryC1/StrS family aminotransferase [Solirubrobacteraceae bacterium]
MTATPTIPASTGMEIPITRPHLAGGEAEAVAAAIASGWISQGPRVREFEAAFAARVGAADAVATTSCTTALALALHVSGVGPGDEVIVPSLSFIATANAVWHCGARPVFADIDPRTYNLDAAAAARAITPRTKAIMPVHQLGLPADMDAFLELAARHGVTIVEDAACAIGARYRDRPIGSLGPLACFSLHPRKVITTGEGGMIAVRDPAVAERLRRLRAHGMDTSDLARHSAHDVVLEAYPERGWNSRMTDIQAALGLCQLRELDWILERRRLLAERYTAALERIPHLEAPYDPPFAQRTWQSYCIRIAPGAPIDRTELMRGLLRDGIATRRGVMAIHEEAAYAERPEVGSSELVPRPDLPHTEAATRETLMLPLFPDLSEEQQDYVIERLAACVLACAA